MRNAPEILEVDSTQLEEVLSRAEQSLDEKDAALIRAVFQSYLYVTDLVEDKNTSIRRLRQLFFGKRTEKTKAVVGNGKPEATPAEATPSSDAAADTALAAGEAVKDLSNEADTRPVAPGHGRNGADAYRGAERIEVPHPSLTAGDPCPVCGEGIVYEKAPGVLVRITGQAPLTATIYQLQKLRCHLCGEVFTAAAPAEAGEPQVRCHGRQHDRALEIWEWLTIQPPRWPAGASGDSSAGLDPVGHRGGGRGEPGSGLRGVDPAGGTGRRCCTTMTPPSRSWS